MEIRSQLSLLLDRCVMDMNEIRETCSMSAEAQVRAYDLMSMLLDSGITDDNERGCAERFVQVYESDPENLAKAYDGKAMTDSVKAALAPLERACTDARFEAASAASLHEFAKETFHTWQTAGIFMRKRALKALRERAGFKLESHRIGNYVAKTFDLMNEAQMRFARAQQAVFAADVTYKIQPGTYAGIADFLKKHQ